MWWALAVAVAVVHAAFIGFVLVGGALSRWRHWVAPVHLAAAAWGLLGLLVPVGCPLTAAEDALRRRAGRASLGDGYVDHYIVDRVLPERLVPIAWLVAGISAAVSLTVLVRAVRVTR